jgi:uncharacterized Fe-S cluster-containing radical SAM superfamily protein
MLDIMLIDPVQLAGETEKIVVKGALRKYYRSARPEKWYGGISSAYCCGCNLRCVFCFSGFPRDNPQDIGQFYSPQQVFKELIVCAQRYGYDKLRITGNEPTLGKEHLFGVIELAEKTNILYILESNGILIGHDEDYARQLARYRHVHVRIPLKGTDNQEFSKLTGAKPNAFDLQLKALENLVDCKVPCNPAVMTSFSSPENVERLREKLGGIGQSLADNLEEESVILYPPVVKRLQKKGIKPNASALPTKTYRSKYPCPH